MAYLGDLAVLATRLRADGLDVRNLGQVGITLWKEDRGFFFPLSELEENAELVWRRDFDAISARRDGSLSHRRRPEVTLVS